MCRSPLPQASPRRLAIASVPSRGQNGHDRGDLHKWGQARLRQLLAATDDSAAVGRPLVIQFSSMSISNNSERWVMEMAKSFCPRDTKLPPLRVVFPTTREVRDSLEGWVAGHSIPCHDSRPALAVLAELQRQERTGEYLVNGMPKHKTPRPEYTACLCRWAAGERERAVPHLKAFTRCSDGADASAEALPWVVTGSHSAEPGLDRTPSGLSHTFCCRY